MKKLMYLMMLVVGVTSCSVEEKADNDVLEVNLVVDITVEATHYFRNPDRFVKVSNDGVTLFVEFATDGPADLEVSRLHIVGDPSEFPVTPGGTLPPGQMDSDNFRNHGGGVQSYIYEFPLSDFEDDCIYIAAWAIFRAGGGTTEHFAGDLGGSNRWSYFVYGECDVIVDQICESAFMKGSHTFYNMRTTPSSPFLNLGNNRWGWAQLVTKGTTYNAPVYAAAGQNIISNGKFVGTATVTNVGNDVHVTIDWEDDVYFNLVHIYASPSQPTTTAPGQFGFTDETPTKDEVFIIPNAASGGTYWVIVHAETCWFE